MITSNIENLLHRDLLKRADFLSTLKKEFDSIVGRGSFVKLIDSNGMEWRFEDGVMRAVEPPVLVFNKGIDD